MQRIVIGAFWPVRTALPNFLHTCEETGILHQFTGSRMVRVAVLTIRGRNCQIQSTYILTYLCYMRIIVT